MTKEHQANLDKANQVVSDSTAMCKEVLEKVEKLIFNAQTFMMTLQTASETNTSKANEAIVVFAPYFKLKKKCLCWFALICKWITLSFGHQFPHKL